MNETWTSFLGRGLCIKQDAFAKLTRIFCSNELIYKLTFSIHTINFVAVRRPARGGAGQQIWGGCRRGSSHLPVLLPPHLLYRRHLQVL